ERDYAGLHLGELRLAQPRSLTLQLHFDRALGGQRHQLAQRTDRRQENGNGDEDFQQRHAGTAVRRGGGKEHQGLSFPVTVLTVAVKARSFRVTILAPSQFSGTSESSRA